MTPKREPYPPIESVPEHILVQARQLIAKRVNPEAKWFYMLGKGDDFAAVQAVIEALMIGPSESPSSSPTSSPCETKQAGAIPPRLRPAPIQEVR